MKAIDIAYYVIEKYNERGVEISNLKLQKIMYYIQGYFYKDLKISAFDEEIFNWPYGPVVPDVYFEFSVFGSLPIYLDEKAKEETLNIKFNRDHKKVIDRVVACCNDKKASQLVEMTHSETPWKSTSKSKVIPQRIIEEYFENHDPLNYNMQD